LISAGDAFLAGLLSFVSACVLPLAPGFIGLMIAAAAGLESRAALRPIVRPRPLLPVLLVLAALFVVGFSVVFILLAVPDTAAGGFLSQHVTRLSRFAGAIIVAVGVAAMRSPALSALPDRITAPAGGLLGMAFAFGWSPCVGPVLAAILGLAGTPETLASGVRMLTIYSAGLSVSFVAVGAATGLGTAALLRRGVAETRLRTPASLVLIATGVLILTDRLTVVAQFLTWYLPEY
jgi:cytochrome c-type biogenesis protein